MQPEKKKSQGEGNYVISNTKCDHHRNLIQRNSYQHGMGIQFWKDLKMLPTI